MNGFEGQPFFTRETFNHCGHFIARIINGVKCDNVFLSTRVNV